MGSNPVSVDRQTRDPVHLNHPLLTIGIAPQPALIQDLVKKPILVKRGLLSRFLFSVPESKVGYRSLKPMSVNEFAKLRYENALKCLLKIPANLNSNGNECPYVIQLTEEAYRIWKDWQHEIEPMLGEDGRLCDPALKAWGGKLAGNTARLAGLLHIASTPPENRPNDIRVSELIMHRAVSAARVLIDHSIAVHDLASTDGARYKAKSVFEYLERREIEQISVRELQQALKQRAAFQRSEDVREAVSVLLELGWLLRAGRGKDNARYHTISRQQRKLENSTAADRRKGRR